MPSLWSGSGWICNFIDTHGGIIIIHINRNLGRFLLGLLLVAAGAAVVFLVFGDSQEHIPDTNGAEDFSLQTITDENICKMDIGAVNVSTGKALLGDTVTYHSDCFSGVYEVYMTNIVANRLEITVNHAEVKAGNFKMVLCVDNEIVHTFALNELTQTFVLENAKGTVSLRIAGESAEFSFDYQIL